MWNRDVARDPHVRLKIGNNLYPEVLLFVTDPAEKEGAFKAMQEKYPHFDLPPGGTINVFRVTNGSRIVGEGLLGDWESVESHLPKTMGLGPERKFLFSSKSVENIRVRYGTRVMDLSLF